MPLIFYIDDSKDDLFYLDYMRRKNVLKADLVTFSQPQEAWEMLQARHGKGEPMPDLLIADLYMPLDGGLLLIRQVSQDPRFAGIRLGVCSGSDAEEDRQRSLAAGAHVFFLKPLNPEDIPLG
jgi:CheY-like chemotaxis protein